MKLTLQIGLMPDAQQSCWMRETLERFNAAASWLAGLAFELRSANRVKLQQLHYQEL